MKKLILIFLFFISSLIATDFTSNPNFLDRGQAEMATKIDTFGVFSNPAILSLFDTNQSVEVEFFNSSLTSTSDGMEFIKELSSTSNSKKTSELMKKNIGKILNFNANNFTSFYQSRQNYNWLVGILTAVDANLITHNGFGSNRAMESFIDKYNILVTSFAMKNENFRYGINLKMVQKYQTIHNYSIYEIIKNDDIYDYIDNEYTKKSDSLECDVGLIYEFDKSKIALSVLNISDQIPTTANLGFARNYKFLEYNNILFTVDYFDIFNNQENSKFLDNLKMDIGKTFFDNNLKITSGIVNQSLKFGLNYNLQILKIDLKAGASSYVAKEFNGEKNRKYQLSLSLLW